MTIAMAGRSWTIAMPVPKGRARQVTESTRVRDSMGPFLVWDPGRVSRLSDCRRSPRTMAFVVFRIFLRHAANRFEAVKKQIDEDLASGRMPKRKVLPVDFVRRRALWLPKEARYDWIMEQAATRDSDLPALVTSAMNAIEAHFEPLQGVLRRTTAPSSRKCSRI